MLGATLAVGTSLLAPATPARVGGRQASAQLVKPRPSFAASRPPKHDGPVKKPRTGERGFWFH